MTTENAPLSPPNSTHKTTSRNNAIHAFFTPRRHPLEAISSNPARPTVHLLSPSDSPTQRLSKKQRVFGKPPFKDDLDAEPLFAPIPPGVGSPKSEESEWSVDPSTPSQPKRTSLKPSSSRRIIMRAIGIGMGANWNIRCTAGHHCSSWRREIEGFYSKPNDSHTVFTHDGRPSLPFTVKACNRNSLVGVGDESGGVRLLESERDGSPGFNKVYLGIMCHDNAVFDISWSPDDHQLATASGDQTCRVFDVPTQTCTGVLAGHRSSIKQVAFNPKNPSVLTTCSRDGSINIWDTRIAGTPSALGQGITEFKPVNSIISAHSEQKKGSNRGAVSVTAATWLLNRDGVIASACEANASIRIWDTRSIQTRRKSAQAIEQAVAPAHHVGPKHRPFGINCLSLSPDGTRMYAMCRDSVVYAYSTSHIENGPIHAYSHPRLHASTFYVKTSVSRDGRLLSCGSSDGVGVVFPTDENYLDRGLYGDFVRSATSHLAADQSLFTSMKQQTAPAVQKYLKVGKGVALVRGHEKEVTDITWTYDGDMVAISDDFQARCWRRDDGFMEAARLRDGGEGQGRRWGCGWAELAY